MSDRLDDFGRRVAAAQDRQRAETGDAQRAEVRARLVELAATPSRARWAWLAAAGGGLLAAAALVLVLAWPRAHALTFELAASHEAGTVGAWLAAPSERTELLRFSDGSEIELEPRAQARVAELDPRLARIVLERGAADVRIEPGGERAWHIDAGPYLVIVTGTQFRVGWDPLHETFELDLREGAVIIEGPQLDGAREVHAGQQVRIAAPATEVASATIPATVEAPEVADEPVVAEPAVAEAAVVRGAPERARRGARASAGLPAPEVSAPPPAWHELADRGSYRDALAAAESLGFATLCTSLPSDQLLRLADVARFARRPGRAIEALEAVRRRFPDGDDAATAAFERGRIALAKRAHDDAAQWLTTYLRERPNGALAREATGRLVEALQGAGKRDAAQDAARDYLSRYPQGPHADLATRVLAGGG